MSVTWLVAVTGSAYGTAMGSSIGRRPRARQSYAADVTHLENERITWVVRLLPPKLRISFNRRLHPRCPLGPSTWVLDPPRPRLPVKSRTSNGSECRSERSQRGQEARGPIHPAHTTPRDEVHAAGPVAHRPSADVPNFAGNSDANPRVTENPARSIIETDSRGVHQPCLKPEILQDDGKSPVVLRAEATAMSECDLR